MMSKTLYDLQAPAKLNLFLHVVGRRSDGYHELESVFALIDWCDTLHIERTQRIAITRTDTQAYPPPFVDAGSEDPANPICSPVLPEQDLTVRAARLLQAYTGCQEGAHIHLHKTIPSQAGLGGGSSDAAVTLLALCRLWRLRLSQAELMQLGLQLGADVPFFLQGQNALVTGIGERILPVKLPAMSWVVIKPPVGLSTPRIFQDPYLTRDTPRLDEDSKTSNLAWWTYGHNDLQAVALRLCPELRLGLDWFGHQGLSGCMTGSGTALFAPYVPYVPIEQSERRKDVTLELPLKGWQMRSCQTLRQHPWMEKFGS
jgi:4-diphosphocytidyl-2-C-methyl-D-erythritol kinase